MTTNTTATAPLALAVLHRPHRPRARWRIVAVVADERGALAVCNARGDWTTKTLRTATEVKQAKAALAGTSIGNTPQSRDVARQRENAPSAGSR